MTWIISSTDSAEESDTPQPAAHQRLPARKIDVECAADELDVTTETRAGTPCEQFVAELERLLGGPNVGRT
jgi:hypothetical protein